MPSTNTPTIVLPTIELPDAWEAPILFDEVNTKDIPAHFLPGCLGEFAFSLASSTETPEALSVMAILGVISTALSKRFVVSPQEGWNEPINIYAIIGLPPANHKSAVLKACTKPLLEFEKEQHRLLENEIKKQCSKRKTEEKIIESLRLRAAKETNSIEQQQLLIQIAEKEGSLTEPDVLPVLFANDATPESLAASICEQKGRFAILSDEGGALETLAGLYTNGISNIDILLKGIDGGDVRIRRKDRSININPYLTIMMAVQPAIIQNMSHKRSFLGNGMLERFLYVLPKSKLGYRTHDKPPVSKMAIEDYESKMKELLSVPPLIHEGQEKPYKLTLSKEAYEAWSHFRKDIECELRPEGRLAVCQGWGGKICGFTLRIAGLLHVAEHSYQKLIINADTMLNAIKAALLLMDHVIAAYGLMAIDQTAQDAKEIFKRLKAESIKSFKKSEITYKMRGKRISIERMDKALSSLISRNVISEPIMLPTRRPTSVYYVNPQILENDNNES